MLIYKITNILNNKIYVGQTKNSLVCRKNSHLQRARSGKRHPLYASMNKHGCDSFVFEVLEEVSDISLLNERETYWINRLDCLYPAGYNLVSFGNNGRELSDYTRALYKRPRGPTPEERKDKISRTLKEYYTIKKSEDAWLQSYAARNHKISMTLKRRAARCAGCLNKIKQAVIKHNANVAKRNKISNNKVYSTQRISGSIGVARTTEVKRKISETLKARYSAEGFSQERAAKIRAKLVGRVRLARYRYSGINILNCDTVESDRIELLSEKIRIPRTTLRRHLSNRTISKEGWYITCIKL